MSSAELWSLADLQAADLSRATVWASASVRERVRSALSLPVAPALSPLSDACDTLVVAGGGTLIDEAKLLRATLKRPLRLIAIPTLWGSGAEASPIAVVNRDGRKSIHIGEEYCPDVRVSWPELAETLSMDRVRAACGDTWAHTLEGFLSPLSDDALRAVFASIIRKLLSLPLAFHPDWFEASARASTAQARSSVGLAHGIAHTLEGPAALAWPDRPIGHAKLCAVYLWPVMQFNVQSSDKWSKACAEHALDTRAVDSVLLALFDAAAYHRLLPHLEANWKLIIRDPCSRTNSALVRRSSLAYFQEFDRGSRS